MSVSPSSEWIQPSYEVVKTELNGNRKSTTAVRSTLANMNKYLITNHKNYLTGANSHLWNRNSLHFTFTEIKTIVIYPCSNTYVWNPSSTQMPIFGYIKSPVTSSTSRTHWAYFQIPWGYMQIYATFKTFNKIFWSKPVQISKHQVGFFYHGGFMVRVLKKDSVWSYPKVFYAIFSCWIERKFT